MKKCNKCCEVKPLDEFGNHKGNKDGKMYTCKACKKAARPTDHNAHVLAWRAERIDRDIPYHQNPHIKRQKAEYRKRPEAQEIIRRSKAKYRNRPEIKERHKQYAASPHQRARRLEYSRSEHAKEARLKRHLADTSVRVRYTNKRRAILANAPSDAWKASEVHSEANGKCLYCGISVTLNEMHADHYIPLAKGGSNLRENIVCSCASCNLSKGAKLPSEWTSPNLIGGSN